MAIKVNDITRTMIEAVQGPLARAVGKRWPAVRTLATQELQKLASTLVKVKRMYDKGEIDAVRARDLLRMQEKAVHEVLRSIKGIGVYTARQSVDAAVRVAASLVGFKDPRSILSAPSPKSAGAVTGAAGADMTASAASTEPPTQEVSPGFKAGKDL